MKILVMDSVNGIGSYIRNASMDYGHDMLLADMESVSDVTSLTRMLQESDAQLLLDSTLDASFARLSSSAALSLGLPLLYVLQEIAFSGEATAVKEAVLEARQLGLDYTTVLRAISALSSAYLIEIKKKGINTHEKGVYVANMDKIHKHIRINKKESKKAEKANKKQAKSKAVRLLDETSDFKRFYDLRREQAKRTAENNKEKAEQNERYKQADKRYRLLELEHAKAELYAPLTLPEIMARKQVALAERASALREIGMTEKDLEPQYVCSKCSDTGYLPNGRQCDCYQRPKGGSKT